MIFPFMKSMIPNHPVLRETARNNTGHSLFIPQILLYYMDKNKDCRFH